MEELRNQMKAVVEKTFNYFLENPSRRAVKYSQGDDGILSSAGCAYFDPKTGNKCAVGIWLENAQEVEEYFDGGDTSICAIYSKDLEFKWVAGAELIPLELWSFLQTWHDKDHFWVGLDWEETNFKHRVFIMEKIDSGWFD